MLYSDELITKDGFRYQVNSDETITITEYQGNETEISIPNEIDGKSVTSIGDCAFVECSTLTIYGEKDSYAQEYAHKINIPFKLSSEYDKDDTNTKPEEPDGTVTPPNDTDISRATTTPSEDNKQDQDTDKPATNSPKEDDSNNKPSDGKPNKTSDVASMARIFTMFTGLIGTIGFKRKRK